MIIELLYLVSAILFILGIRDLSSPVTARRGNLLASLGMFFAVVGTLLHHDSLQVASGQGVVQAYGWIVAGMALGGIIGAVMAHYMPMTAMPERIAIVNGLGGAASCLVGIAEYVRHAGEGLDAFTMGVIGFEVMLGALTFTGSMIAFAKLRGLIKGLFTFPLQNTVSVIWVVAMLAIVAELVVNYLGVQWTLFWILLAMAMFFGIMFVQPIGGADMPVVIAMLKADSGLAAAATGFALDNKVLIIAGSLDGASGLLLSILMCRAMNRSIMNVLFGGVGQTVAMPAGGKVKKACQQRSA